MLPSASLSTVEDDSSPSVDVTVYVPLAVVMVSPSAVDRVVTPDEPTVVVAATALSSASVESSSSVTVSV